MFSQDCAGLNASADEMSVTIPNKIMIAFAPDLTHLILLSNGSERQISIPEIWVHGATSIAG